MASLRLLRPVAAFVFATALSFPALAAPVAATANYIVTLGGINIAEMAVKLNDDGKHYSIDASANVAGLGSIVASGMASVQSAGTSSGPALVSQKFDVMTRANGEDFSVKVAYAGKNVESFVVTPPIVDNVGRVPIERSQLTGVNDFLASFVLKGGALDKSLCARKARIFTGVERFDIAMVFTKEDVATSQRTGYQGPVILCNVRYTPISGHFTTSEVTKYLADSDRILVWYAPLEQTGYFIPYRVLLTTTMGDLSMVLTGIR